MLRNNFISRNEIITAIGACVISGVVLHLRRQKRLAGKDADNAVVSYQLTKQEGTFYMVDMPAMSTITWFKGDFRAAHLHLEKRMRHIIEKNPWVQGRIQTTSLVKGTCHLSYAKRKDDNIDVGQYLAIVDPCDSPVARSSSIEDLGIVIQKAGLMIKNGPEDVIFRATVIPCAENPNERFGVMVQLSHVAGDGATYYKLMHMLLSSDANIVVGLNPERILNSQEMQVAAMGKDEEAHLTSFGYTMRVIAGMAASKLFRRTVSFKFGWVDASKMKECKEDAAKEASIPFVSTNDVITSWFMNQTCCPMGVMALNWRNRLEGHTDLHAGNYENTIFYQNDDHARPALIRKSLKTFKRAVTKDEPMPGWWRVASTSGSVVTNWSTFAKPNVIEGCEEDIHLPIGAVDCVPTSMQLLLIFRASAGKLGVCYFHSSGENHLDHAPFLTD